MAATQRPGRPLGAVLRGAALGWWCLVGSFGAAMPAAADPATPAEAVARGPAAGQAGGVAEAVETWSAAERRAAATGDTGARVEALLRRADAYQSLGLLDQAAADLEEGRDLARAAGDARRQAMAAGMLGFIELTRGRSEKAEQALDASLALAKAHDLPAVMAATLANRGLLLTMQGEYDTALSQPFEQSLAMANRAGDPALLATVQINRARAALARERAALAAETPDRAAAASARATAAVALDAAAAALDRMAPAPEQGRLRVAWAASMLDRQELAERPEPSELRRIYGGLREARDLAARFGDRRTLSFADGHLGRLYEMQQRHDEALDLTNEAIRLAQRTDAPDLLYQWFWQIGRLRRATGATDRAIAAYQQAVDHLQKIRSATGQLPDALGRPFSERPGVLYRQMADLLLQRAERVAASGRRAAAQEDLERARDVMNKFKKGELEDYFGGYCSEEIKSKTTTVDKLLQRNGERTAVLYPVMLPDRTALILTIGGTHELFTVPIGEAELAREISKFRKLLEPVRDRDRAASPDRSLGAAQRLHNLLIEPVRVRLTEQRIHTLVFVPDGPLYTVPIAALHDGSQFLVERYATVVVPGLTLLEPHRLSRRQIRVLVGALATEVPGFKKLLHVKDEVEAIKKVFPSDILENEYFVESKVRTALKRRPYSIVHIASHARFDEKSRDSFLVTYGGRKLSMNQLERLILLSYFRDIPIQLLVLSACNTAMGDDRAALGLAGIAVKAGARSAIGSLWLVKDEAAVAFVTKFYQELENEGVSKAEALRQAQLSLIRHPEYRDATYWASFLLIGNWL